MPRFAATPTPAASFAGEAPAPPARTTAAPPAVPGCTPGARPSGGAIEVHPPRDRWQWAAARRLLVDYFDWLAPLAGVESVPAVQPSAAAELDDLAAVYRQPSHRFLMAAQGGLPVGIVGIKPHRGLDVAELVRFYSRPAARGQGIGDRLLAAAVDAARDIGYRRVILDTAPSFMATAVHLYRKHGFTPAADEHQLPVSDAQRFELGL